jgi:hypothetical protein
MTTWPTKQQAAAELQISERTLERHIKAGRVETKKEKRSGQMPATLCNPDDVARLRQPAHVMPTLAAPPAPAPERQAEPAGALIRKAIEQLATIATPVPTAPQNIAPWLRLEDAAANSGLSRRLLKSLAESGQIAAIKDGRTWKISWQHLRIWRPSKTSG